MLPSWWFQFGLLKYRSVDSKGKILWVVKLFISMGFCAGFMMWWCSCKGGGGGGVWLNCAVGCCSWWKTGVGVFRVVWVLVSIVWWVGGKLGVSDTISVLR